MSRNFKLALGLLMLAAAAAWVMAVMTTLPATHNKQISIEFTIGGKTYTADAAIDN